LVNSSECHILPIPLFDQYIPHLNLFFGFNSALKLCYQIVWLMRSQSTQLIFTSTGSIQEQAKLSEQGFKN